MSILALLRGLAGAAIIAAPVSASAEDPPRPNGPVDPTKIDDRELVGVKMLPFRLSALEFREPDSSGLLYFQSEDGRFWIRAQVVDLHSGERVKELGPLFAPPVFNMQTYERRHRAGLKPITLGDGPQRVILVADPLCPWCDVILKEIGADGFAGYTIDVVLLPIVGRENSVARIRALECAVDQDAARRALVSGNYAGLEQRRGCTDGAGAFTERLSWSRLVGLKGVPLVIGPNGSMSAGKPQDFAQFLESTSVR